MAELADYSGWILSNANDNDAGLRVKGPHWTVKEGYGNQPIVAAGYTPYDAWFSAFEKAGYSRYMAHELAMHEIGADDPARGLA